LVISDGGETILKKLAQLYNSDSLTLIIIISLLGTVLKFWNNNEFT